MEAGGCLGASVEKEDRGSEWTAWSEDTLGCTGRDSSHSWSAFRRGGTASLGTKELAITTELLHSLAEEQRCLVWAANLDDGFLLCFPINSDPCAFR